MARLTSEIENQIFEEIQNNEILSEQLTSASKSAVWRNIVFVISYCVHLFEKLIDQHRIEIDEQIAASRIHTQKWYREKAREFMYGYSLNDSDQYDTSGLTDQQIASAKIIANAAPVKMQGYLRMKVVKSVGDELEPLDSDEMAAFTSYMNYVTDAGTYVIPTTNVADDLKLTLNVYYNDLVLNGNGSRRDGTASNPVQDAIKDYLKCLRFNGSFIESMLEKEIEAVDGVTMVKVVGAWSKYGSYGYDSTTNPNAGKINEIRIADAGYMKLDESSTVINFIPFSDYE